MMWMHLPLFTNIRVCFTIGKPITILIIYDKHPNFNVGISDTKPAFHYNRAVIHTTMSSLINLCQPKIHIIIMII